MSASGHLTIQYGGLLKIMDSNYVSQITARYR